MVKSGWDSPSRGAKLRARALALGAAGILVTVLLSPTSIGARATYTDHGVANGVTKLRIHRHRRVKIRKHSGGFPSPVTATTQGDVGEMPSLPEGPFRPPSDAPPPVPLFAAGTTAAPATGSGLSVQATRTLPASTFPAGIYQPFNPPSGYIDTLTAQEPSVADAGRVVLYAFNWDAGYSTDGGLTFRELDPHTTFHHDIAPYFVHFGTDQVVTYDPTTQTFIWVLQEFSSGVEDVIRIAWANASKLVQYGSFAWKSIELPSDACCGVGSGHFLDQPRLGFTDRYLYMNVNQFFHNATHNTTTLQGTVIVRIPRAQLGTPQGPTGYGYAFVDTGSLRVAQNVAGPTEFFVGHKDTSTFTVASIADNSNVVATQQIAEPTVADKDWAINTPGGQNLLGRQAISQGTGVTGVTQDGDGNLWVAWSEGRAFIDANGHPVTPQGQPTQPHIAVALLSVGPGSPPTITLKEQFGRLVNDFWNVNYALFLPELATDASGEVAMVFDWGGGTAYLNHAVAFLSGGYVDQTVAGSTTDQSTTGVSGDNNLNNPAGDYQTVRALPPPNGDCFVAAGDVNQDTSDVPAGTGTTHVGLPVFTLFSRPGAACPIRIFPPPPPIGETMGLSCPGTVNQNQAYAISGALSPAVDAASVMLTYTSSARETTPVTHAVSTNSDGNFSDLAPAAPAGTETIAASYAGDSTHAGAQQTCSVTIQSAG